MLAAEFKQILALSTPKMLICIQALLSFSLRIRIGLGVTLQIIPYRDPGWSSLSHPLN